MQLSRRLRPDRRHRPLSLRGVRILATLPRPFAKPKRKRSMLPARLRTRRVPARKPGLAGAFGAGDQAVLRFLRTRAPHDAATESAFKALGTIGEYAAVWVAIGLAGAAADQARRKRWLIGAATGPGAVVANYALKLSFGRERPLIEDHPPLARAPSKLSFPSAHATSSMAAATAFGRVEPQDALTSSTRWRPRSAFPGPTSACTTPPTFSPARLRHADRRLRAGGRRANARGADGGFRRRPWRSRRRTGSDPA